jgi:pyrroloquinoline-quinone synthase
VSALSPDEFARSLRERAVERYHDRHPFHVRMHQGLLSRAELRTWVVNRFYYQTRIPIKDALILSKAEDPAFRRRWIRRLVDHDGSSEAPGGLELWLRLGEAVGVPAEELVALEHVLPAARTACDAYVELVRSASLLEAVAASLTETLAPRLLESRTAAWLEHYSWVPEEALAYFRVRVPLAERDGKEALEYVVARARTAELQQRCLAALLDKTRLLWRLLDAVAGAPAELA